MKILVSLVALGLTCLLLACGPQAEPEPGIGTFAAGTELRLGRALPGSAIVGSLKAKYRQWGIWINYGRDPDLRWADGSNWVDGVSHDIPTLPLRAARYEKDDMTCAQGEVLLVTAFPQGEDIETWHTAPHRAEILQQWERNYARLIWGPKPQALEWSKRMKFQDWCGRKMRRR